ncbi:MBL fold metallo-hydrolase [Methanoculleus receptaculi]|jgi:phosphoribosyl 1,2-cyclic phosphate phosphodiesterase|uniref:MBL fold metallo-hydrolase n=1 Tax=Methanoculleus receptaculi TaxID=394967 RepID=A0AAX4FW74_9EURY|nr:MBL fold metallo-hydrolase [Methanoculleus receptaculi]WOX58191.1 MBL fold metallo-hydrolase [Methanoculleus receptaculi]
MRITLLGTGDAIGTPKVGCNCKNCREMVARGWSRLRTSFIIEIGGKHILVESSPDLRQQLLRVGSPHIDAVIWSHGHYDHFIGFGEFYRVQKVPPAYAAPPVMDYCSDYLHFLSFEKHAVPAFESFGLFGLTFTFFPVNHPPVYTCGLLLEHDDMTIAYTSDTREDIPADSRELVAGREIDLLFVDAIAPEGHNISKHMNYAEAVRFAADVGAKDYRCVHMSHLVPPGMPHAGYDMEKFCW